MLVHHGQLRQSARPRIRVVASDQRYTQELYEKADEIENERAEQEPPYDYEELWERTDNFGDDVQGMFDGLKSELRDTTDR